MDGSDKTRSLACQFCGVMGSLTREHVLGQWVRPLLRGSRAPYVERIDAEITRTWDAPIASLAVRRVCRGCNNGWMNDLEVSAKPVLTALIEGEATSLSPEQQGILAVWATKTAMAYDLTRLTPAVPSECRLWLREKRIPPPATVVLLARYAGARFPLFAAHGITKFQVRVEDEIARPWLGYLLSISVGPVVVQIFGHGMANAVDLRPRGWKADFAHVIWPYAQPLAWPLPRALGDDCLQRFAQEV